MAWCPFLSFKPKSVSRPREDVSSILYDHVIGTGYEKVDEHTGDTWPNSVSEVGGEYPVSIVQTITPSDDDIINYHTSSDNDPGNNIEWTNQGLFVCPESTSCQLWDDKNSRCGAKSSDYLNNDTEAESETALTNLFKGMIGNYSERDGDGGTTDSLHVFLKNLVGIRSERDDSGVDSLTVFLQNLLGTKSERDDSGADSLVTYLQNLIGKKSEREDDFAAPDGDGLPLSLLRQFIKIIGSMSELDIDTADEIAADDEHYIGSQLKTLTHVHNIHRHDQMLDGDHLHPPIAGNVPAINLILEFLTKEDADSDTKPLGTTSSIYGEEWMITEDDECPPVLIAIHQHTDWVSPSVSITWSEYLDLLEETLES